MQLQKIEDYVIQALEQKPLTRQNDFVLYGAVLKRMGIDILLPLAELFGNSKKYNLPAMESVTRARRKVQEQRPELCDTNTVLFRQEKINDYIDYALDK
ncbi:MAG: hypothetical protein GX638_04190 [Crenarchaeota archaeon]|nr:hypothetical protein [Thermoproteota archaeon]